MIPVVVIDDEPLTVRHVSRMIEKDERFQVVGQAYNGQKGLEVIRAQKPKVVFVDIFMPVMDGMQMIQELRREKNEATIIILSGYSEFEKAQQAIRLNVMDYLLKPVNTDKLSELMEKIKKQSQEKDIEEIGQQLSEIIYHGRSREDMHVDLGKFGVYKICLGAFNFYRHNQLDVEKSIEEETKLTDIIKQVIQKEDIYWIFSGRYGNEYLLVTRGGKGQAIDTKRIYQLLIGAFNKPVTFIYSCHMYPMARIKEITLSMESVLYYNSVFGESRLLESTCPMDLPKQTLRIEEEIKDWIRLNDLKDKDINQDLIKIFDRAKKEHMTQARLIDLIRRLIMGLSHDTVILDIDFMISEVIAQATTYDSLLESISVLIDDLRKLNQPEEKGDTKYVIEEIKRYLKLHFSEKIKIQEVAADFGLNFSYLCILFKKMTGWSPNEYVIQQRIEYSKELLASFPSLTVKEVAERVGYSDPYYFSRIFKANTKLSPTEYRIRQGNLINRD